MFGLLQGNGLAGLSAVCGVKVKIDVVRTSLPDRDSAI